LPHGPGDRKVGGDRGLGDGGNRNEKSLDGTGTKYAPWVRRSRETRRWGGKTRTPGSPKVRGNGEHYRNRRRASFPERKQYRLTGRVGIGRTQETSRGWRKA